MRWGPLGRQVDDCLSPNRAVRFDFRFWLLPFGDGGPFVRILGFGCQFSHDSEKEYPFDDVHIRLDWQVRA